MTQASLCRRANLFTYGPSFLKGAGLVVPQEAPRGDTQIAGCRASLRQPAGLSVLETEKREGGKNFTNT